MWLANRCILYTQAWWCLCMKILGSRKYKCKSHRLNSFSCSIVSLVCGSWKLFDTISFGNWITKFSHQLKAKFSRKSHTKLNDFVQYEARNQVVGEWQLPQTKLYNFRLFCFTPFFFFLVLLLPIPLSISPWPPFINIALFSSLCLILCPSWPLLGNVKG